MTGKKPTLSIVCPAYEEEEVLPIFHERLVGVLAELEADYQFEFIYVDDGSTDGTLEQLRQLAARDVRVHYLSLSRNFGKEAALSAGLAHASGDAVVTMDSDLQHPPEIIPQLLSRWREGHDIVRTERLQMHKDSTGRRLSAWVFHRLMRWLSGDAKLATSDYQLLSRRVIDALSKMPEAHRYVRGLVSWMGFPTSVVFFDVALRGGGTSKFTPSRLLALASDGVLSFSRLPLRLALVVGLILLLLGLTDAGGVLLWLLISGLPGHWELHALATLELVLSGFVLCGMGVVGEYVGRIYEQVKQRPIYLLKESSLAGPGQTRAGHVETGAGQPPWPSTGASAA